MIYKTFRTGLMIVLMLGLSACDVLVDGMAKAQAVEEQLESSLGAELEVGFTWSNGRFERIDIMVISYPETLSLAELSSLSKQAVLAHFKALPDSLLVSVELK